MKLLFNIVIIFCLMLLSSCGISKPQPSNTSSSGISIEPAKNSTNSDVYKTYIETDRDNNIVIKYPTLQGKGFEKSNELIKNTLRNLLTEDYGNGYSGLDLKMDYKITFQNNSLISIVFEGLGNVKTAAHPMDQFISLNINLKNGTRIKLSDMYIISNNFKKIYFETAKEQVPENGLTKEQWISLIEGLEEDSTTNWYFENADSVGGLQSYLTQNGLGLSMPVAFAVGDHFETVIPYSNITPYIKTNKTIELLSIK